MTDHLRALFPHTERMAYLDHASTGPLSRPVMDAVAAYLQQRHATQPNNYFDIAPTLDRGRARLAQVLGTQVERVEYAPNTSYALNVLAHGLDWQPGDRIAVPGCEFPANVFPWRSLEARGVVIDFIPTEHGTFTLDAAAATLRPETRLVAVSWVQFLSGFRADLAALADLVHDHGALLSVDAIQGVGAVPIGADGGVEALGLDFLACGCHKWLMGMQGVGFFYVTEALQARLRPQLGWLNGPIDWDDLTAYDTVLHDDATRFRLGTLNTAGIVALDAALGVYHDVGPDAAWQHIQALTARLADGLDALGLPRYGSRDPDERAGIVTVAPDEVGQDADTLYEALAAEGIMTAVRDRKLRFAPSYTNTLDEIERALDVLGVALGASTMVAQ
ncbi:MAG: aminotransferase class V-fold PLP-dependent enzyme [Bacteroidota bacterium]